MLVTELYYQVINLTYDHRYRIRPVMINRAVYNTSKVVLFGVGQLAEVATYYLNKIVNLIYSPAMRLSYKNSDSFNKSLLFLLRTFSTYPPPEYKLTIGYKHLNKARQKVYHAAKDNGYSFISYVHSSVM